LRATRHVAVTIGCLALISSRAAWAADWIEVKSAHFRVISDAGQGTARTTAWQLEQIRGVLASLWPWAQVDLDRPLVVFNARDEGTMKLLAPQYWREKGSVHPASVWATGPDQYYLALRADVLADDKRNINPFVSSYFSYVSLILNRSVKLPFWYERGLAGVMSNTVVRDAKINLGPAIPWHLDDLRNHSRLHIAQLIKIRHTDPEIRGDDGLRRFDAETWALVHFLMFGERGARAAQLQKFTNMVAGGSDPDVAFRETLGPPESLDGPFAMYVNRSIFGYTEIDSDVTVKRESFPVRPLPAAESASLRALFHVAMARPVDARAAIDEARKADPKAPESYVAEGLLLDRENKPEEAAAAFTHATENGSTSSYAYYRLTTLLWRPDSGRDVWTRQDALLTKAVELNNRNAYAYAYLGDIRSALGSPTAIGLVRRAIALEPLESDHHRVAAEVLHRAQQDEEASKEAQLALGLAKTDREAQLARELTERLKSGRGGG
jgi:tetratricopeptide (TPR) repeat protein